MTARMIAAARRDLYDRIDWYEERETGLGEEFNDEVEAALRAIVANPRQYSPTEDSVAGFETRVYFRPRFRHLITYLVRESEVIFLSIERGRKRTASWVDRLTEE